MHHISYICKILFIYSMYLHILSIILIFNIDFFNKQNLQFVVREKNDFEYVRKL